MKRLLVLGALLALALFLPPVAAHAAVVLSDPAGLIMGIAALFPVVYPYVKTILAFLGTVGAICVLVTTRVPAPSATAPRWWSVTYQVLNFLAGNFGQSINAVPVGLDPAARGAALASARQAHAAVRT